MVNTLLFISILSISILFYCVALDRVESVTKSLDGYVLSTIKMYIIVPSSVVLTWLFITKILMPAHLVSLYPFFAVLIFLCLAVFCEVLIRITTNTSSAEFSISFLCVLLSISESISLLESLIISLCCVTAFTVFVPLVFALRNYLKVCSLGTHFKNESVIYISIAIMIIALMAYNISWLNPGVLP
ncbi:MAG: hypothetical protein K6E51_08660 [Treponema sp.]|nr:hypothetical protein [Treponema sp.]